MAPEPAADVAEPDQDLANRLFVALGRVGRSLRQESTGPRVGPSALSALTTLSLYGPMRLGELAEREMVGPSSVSRILTALETEGYAARAKDPADGRAALVQATDEGQRAVREGRAARVAALRRRLDRASPADRDLLVAALPVLETLAAPVNSP